jgi:hypothetical protein
MESGDFDKLRAVCEGFAEAYRWRSRNPKTMPLSQRLTELLAKLDEIADDARQSPRPPRQL